MGLGDLFKANENQQLRARVAELEALLTPEMCDLDKLHHKLSSLKQEISDEESKAEELNGTLSDLLNKIEAAKANLVETNEAVLMTVDNVRILCYCNLTRLARR